MGVRNASDVLKQLGQDLGRAIQLGNVTDYEIRQDTYNIVRGPVEAVIKADSSRKWPPPVAKFLVAGAEASEADISLVAYLFANDLLDETGPKPHNVPGTDPVTEGDHE